MKKLIICILICFPFTVLAIDYKYSYDYIESDYYNITKEKVYKFYKESKIYTDDYFLEGLNPKDYSYKSDIFINKESAYSFDEPNKELNREILTKKVSGSYSLKPINRIVLRDFNALSVRLIEIEIYYDGEKIDYDYDCFNCSGHAVIYLNNNNFIESNGTIKYDSVVDINLLKEYDPTKILLKAYFLGWDEQVFKFNTYFYDNSVKERFSYLNNYSSVDYIKFSSNVDTKTFNNLNHTESINLKLEKENIIRYKWNNELIFTNEQLSNDFYQKENDKTMYKYIDKYYKYYKIFKTYIDDYYLENNDYIKDETNYKIRYKYEKIKQLKTIENCSLKKEEQKKETKEKEVSKTVINNIKQEPKIYKYRHAYIVIILTSLFLMGYMIHCLRKE